MQASLKHYNDNEVVQITQYNSLMDNYKEALCGIIDHVINLNIISLKMKIQIPFIKNYINDDDNDSELLENGLCYLLENKDIILNFNFDNVLEFSDNYKQTSSQNQVIDLIDDLINLIKKNKNTISNKNIKIIKNIFKYIFDILEKLNSIFL
jgi:hypothetical protein